MPIQTQCPLCETKFTVPSLAANGRTNCTFCAYEFSVLNSSAAGLPAAASTKASSLTRRSSFTQTFIICGSGVLIAAATLGGLYGYYRHTYGWEMDNRPRIESLKNAADEATARGDKVTADKSYSEILALAQGHVPRSEALTDIIATSKTEHASLERQRVDQQKADADKSKLDAEKAQADAGKKQEELRLAKLAADEKTKAAADEKLHQEDAARLLTPEQIVDKYSAGVALIKSSMGSGSGFLIAPNLLITNCHVVEDSPISLLKILFPSSTQKEQTKPTQILFRDYTRDIAVLTVPSQQKPLSLASQFQFHGGQAITVIGNPGAGNNLILENAVSVGVLSSKAVIDKEEFIQLSIAINPGNSGGPVFDSHGQVIGVVTMKASRKEGIAFSIPHADILNAIAQAQKISPAQSAALLEKHNTVAVARRLYTASDVYLMAMAEYVGAMADSLLSGSSARSGLAEARLKIEPKLKEVNKDIVSEIGPLAKMSDPKTNAAVRSKVAELLANYMEIKAHVDDPKGTFDTYAEKRRQLSDTNDRIAHTLSSLLGEDVTKD